MSTTRRTFVTLAAATLGALALPGRVAFAMQNIKCIPHDRKLRAAWTEEATDLQGRVGKALDKAKEGKAPGAALAEKLQAFSTKTLQTAERIETEGLRKTFQEVGTSLKEHADALAEAGSAKAAQPHLRETRDLLRTHTR